MRVVHPHRPKDLDPVPLAAVKSEPTFVLCVKQPNGDDHVQ